MLPLNDRLLLATAASELWALARALRLHSSMLARQFQLLCRVKRPGPPRPSCRQRADASQICILKNTLEVAWWACLTSN